MKNTHTNSHWRMPKQLILMILGLTLAGLSACHRDPYVQAWYSVYGAYDANGRYVGPCAYGTPRPGCNFYKDGSKIVMEEDPYYHRSIQLEDALWEYTDSYGYRRFYDGWAWWSASGILYTEDGIALNEENGGSDSSDWFIDRKKAEKAVVERAAKSLALNFEALNEADALKISKTLNQWALIGKKRARTKEDVAAYSLKLYGVNVEKASKAIEKSLTGDVSEIEVLNEDVARHWGTTPATSKAILKTWYKGALSELNLK